MVTIIFQISDATPIIRLLIRIISDLKVHFKYLADLDEMSRTKQLKGGECKGNNFFQNSDATTILRLLIKLFNSCDF